METISKTLDQLLAEFQEMPENRQDLEVVSPRQSYTPKLPSESSKSETLNGQLGKKLKDCKESQNQLTVMLQQTYSLLKKFGEAADVAALRDDGFQWILGDYTIDQIREAFTVYLKTNREIPTPSDIVGIINPWSKPLCGRVYQKLLDELKEKGQFAITEKEHEYIARYEQQKIQH